MTVAESIKQWLYNYPDINIEERIDTDILDARAVAYALAKGPNNVVVDYIDGSQMRTEYYTFFSRQNTQLETDRINNNKFLEELGEWVREKNMEGYLPALDNNRFCESVGISSGYYMYETEESESIYSFTLEIVYRKEIG